MPHVANGMEADVFNLFWIVINTLESVSIPMYVYFLGYVCLCVCLGEEGGGYVLGAGHRKGYRK